MNNKKIIKQTLASLMAMALTVSGGTAIAAPIMSGMTPVTASAVEIDTGLNITETVQTNLDDDLKTALEITSGIIFKALEEVKPYGMFVGPAFEPLIGMFFDGPIDPTQDKLDDINGKLDKVFDRIDELQSTILKGIDKKLGIQSFYEQSLAFASVTEAMNDKINEINADDSLSNYDKMAKIGSLAGNYSEWQAYFEKDMIALNKLTVSPSLDTSGNIFELVYNNCCENAMFSGEALDQAKPICNLVMMNYTAGIMTLTECLSAQYYVNNLPAEAKAQIDPEFMAHICKNNYDIEKELVKVNRYIAGDSEGSGTTFMDLYNNVFNQSRSILVNKGACNIELAPVLQVNNTNEVQDTTQKNKDAQYRTGKISEWFNNNIYNGQVSDSYVKSIVDYAKSHGKTVRTLLNENGFDTSNIPANTPLLSKQAYYDGTCYVVKQHAHSYFDGFNIDNASCEEEDHVFWNIGFNQYVVYIEDWDFKESHDLCQFRIAVKEEPESAELTLSSVCEEMEEDSDAVTGNDPDTDEQTTDIAYGDVDGDGKLNLTDAVLIMKFMSNKEKYPLTPEEMERADVVDKGESGISGADALAIQMIDANLISADELPISYSELCSRLD